MDVAMISHFAMVFGLFSVIISHLRMIECLKMRVYTYKNGPTPHFAKFAKVYVVFTQHVV